MKSFFNFTKIQLSGYLCIMIRLLTLILTIISAGLAAYGTDQAATRRALVSIPVACLRSAPSSAAELVSQALLGTPVALVNKQGEWWDVITPDGYHGYMTESSLTDTIPALYTPRRLMVVTSMPGTTLYDHTGGIVSPLPAGSIVAIKAGTVILPDGREGFTDPGAMTDYETWRSRQFDPAQLAVTARALTGAPYLWGGMSPAAMDCSGLIRIAYWSQGRLLPRDASQQALEGKEIDIADIAPGDLVFYDRNGSGRVTHVAIYAGDGRLIHSSATVHENALDHDSPDTLTGTILHIRRTSGTIFSF